MVWLPKLKRGSRSSSVHVGRHNRKASTYRVQKSLSCRFDMTETLMTMPVKMGYKDPEDHLCSQVYYYQNRYGRTNVLHWLLTEADQGATGDMPVDKNGVLALHYAAARGCLDCVKMLIESPTLDFK